MKPIKLIFILTLTQVTACSYFFPDKEKDYVYSKEIKPLDIPPDLQAEASLPQLDPVLMPVTLSNTILHIDDGTATYLLINSPFAHAWRVVGKALSASTIEITDKNRSFATYYVQYDPDAPVVEDDSFWGNFFSFKAYAYEGRPYQIFLTQTEKGTEIVVRDDFGDTLNHGDGLKLLNLLYEMIEKDFAYSKRITPLDTSADIPPDLQAEESLTEPGPVMPVTSSKTITNIDDETEVYVPDLQAEESLPESDPVLMPATISINTIMFVDEGTVVYLRVNSPFTHAWRVVGKALTARSIEITDKNRSNAIYYVQYDPDVLAVQDGSFWDEVVFFFGDDANQERAYQVFLTQTEQGTEIVVRDDFGDDLNHGDGLKLLNLLYEAIQEDFAR